MPIYCYKCPKCSAALEISRPITNENTAVFCDCGTQAKRDYQAEGAKPGVKEYAKPIVSDALAIHPDDAPQHVKDHPTVGVLPDGRLEFRDTHSHDKYLKKIGWHKE